MKRILRLIIKRLVGGNSETAWSYIRFYALTLLSLGSCRTRSLNGLDKKAFARIGRKNGFFIEAGAYDGVEQSNTFLLGKHYGWQGLLVEPVPKYARLCGKFRRDAIVKNCALGSFDDRGQSMEILVSGLMSVANMQGLDGIDNPTAHAEAGRAFTGAPSVPRATVNIRPLSDLLDEIGVDHVDLLSLDVEGNEMGVFHGIDFGRHKIDYILVETRDLARVTETLAPSHEFCDRLSHHDYLFSRKA